MFSDFFILPNLTSQLSSTMFWSVYYDLFSRHVWSLFVMMLILLFSIMVFSYNKFILDTNVLFIGKIFICISLLTILPMFGISRKLWEIIPFFKYIQFPVRWLPITIFSFTLVVALFLHIAEKTFVSIWTYYGTLIFIFFILLILDCNYIINAYRFTEDELLRVKSPEWAQEHLPAGVQITGFRQGVDSSGEVVILGGEGKAEILVWKSAVRVANVAANTPLTIRIRTFYFPGWTAYIDDVKSEIAAEEGLRAILVNVPKGSHRLKLIFSDTPVRFYGKIVSSCSLLFFSAILVMDVKKLRGRFCVDGAG